MIRNFGKALLIPMQQSQVPFNKLRILYQRIHFILLLIIHLFVTSQVKSQSFIKQQVDLTIGTSISQLSIQTFDVKQPVGIYYEYMVLNGIGVQGSFAAANNYFEFGTGIFSHAILFLMSKGKGADPGLGWICVPFFFEHTNFHFPIGKRIEFVPYLSLWRVRYYWQQDTPYSKNMFNSSCAGAKLTMQVSKSWIVSSFIEGTHVYNSERLKGWQVGLNLGYLYRKKKLPR